MGTNEQLENRLMAVQQNKVSRARRDKRRSHHRLKAPTLSIDPTSGEIHRRHQVTADGFYRGKQVVDPGGREEEDE